MRLLKVIARELVLWPSLTHCSLHHNQVVFPVACVLERICVGAAELWVILSRWYEVSVEVHSAFQGLWMCHCTHLSLPWSAVFRQSLRVNLQQRSVQGLVMFASTITILHYLCNTNKISNDNTHDLFANRKTNLSNTSPTKLELRLHTRISA